MGRVAIGRRSRWLDEECSPWGAQHDTAERFLSLGQLSADCYQLFGQSDHRGRQHRRGDLDPERASALGRLDQRQRRLRPGFGIRWPDTASPLVIMLIMMPKTEAEAQAKLLALNRGEGADFNAACATWPKPRESAIVGA
jgi:hypothetical protein